MNTQRAKICEGFRQRIEAFYGPRGARDEVFREVVRKLWNPGALPKPSCTVIDNGQDVVEHYEGEADLLLHVQVVLEYETNASLSGGADDWSDLVQDMINHVENWAPGELDVNLIDYVSDDPWDVDFSSGGTVRWHEINFDVDYHIVFAEFEKTTVMED